MFKMLTLMYKQNTRLINSPVYPQTMWYCWPGKTLV